MPLLPDCVHRFNAIPNKAPASCFVDISKLILKFVWRGERPRIANTVLKEKNKVERVALPNFKTLNSHIF